MALIREKRALIFPDNPLAYPVLISGPESELKMAANSTNWEADLTKVGLKDGEAKEWPVLGQRIRDLHVNQRREFYFGNLTDPLFIQKVPVKHTKQGVVGAQTGLNLWFILAFS
jgi:hypothetical protein